MYPDIRLRNLFEYLEWNFPLSNIWLALEKFALEINLKISLTLRSCVVSIIMSAEERGKWMKKYWLIYSSVVATRRGHK